MIHFLAYFRDARAAFLTLFSIVFQATSALTVNLASAASLPLSALLFTLPLPLVGPPARLSPFFQARLGGLLLCNGRIFCIFFTSFRRARALLCTGRIFCKYFFEILQKIDIDLDHGVNSNNRSWALRLSLQAS